MPPLDDWDWERLRGWLHQVVHELTRDPRLERRLDSSDLIQQTLLRAQQAREQFRGRHEGEPYGWLKQILENVVIDEARKHRAGKRDVALEQSLQAAVNDSSL